MNPRVRLALLPALALVGCGDPAGEGPYGDSSPVDVANFTWCDVQTRILEPSCISCHSDAGAAFSGDLSLQTGAYANIVGVSSVAFPALTLVIPSDSANSYFVHKLTGTHNEAGGGGSKMPIGGSLSEDLIAGLNVWIDAGANESCDGFVEPTPTATGTPTAAPTPTATQDPNGTPTPTALPGAYTYAQVQGVWNTKCSGCHVNAGNSPSAGLNLTDPSHNKIVGVPSIQSDLNLIEPGDPDASYLWHKLNNTQASVGGSGALMPMVGGAVEDEDLEGIRLWILSGARP